MPTGFVIERTRPFIERFVFAVKKLSIVIFKSIVEVSLSMYR